MRKVGALDFDDLLGVFLQILRAKEGVTHELRRGARPGARTKTAPLLQAPVGAGVGGHGLQTQPIARLQTGLQVTVR